MSAQLGPDKAVIVRPKFIGDSMLLALHEAEAARGNTVSAYRAQMLRNKLLADAERELDEHRQRQYDDQFQVSA